MPLRLLLVDDEPNILLTLSQILESEGFDVETAPSAKAARACFSQSKFDVVLTDLSLESSLSGFEIVGFARRHTSKPAIIVLSGFPDLLSKWKEKGADAGFQKPIDIRELVSTIKTLLLLRDWKRNRGSR